MKKISAYQATDGEVFTNKNNCKAYQEDLNIVSAVEIVASKFNPANGSTVSSNPIAAFIIENREELQKALSGKWTFVSEESLTASQAGLIN